MQYNSSTVSTGLALFAARAPRKPRRSATAAPAPPLLFPPRPANLSRAPSRATAAARRGPEAPGRRRGGRTARGRRDSLASPDWAGAGRGGAPGAERRAAQRQPGWETEEGGQRGAVSSGGAERQPSGGRQGPVRGGGGMASTSARPLAVGVVVVAARAGIAICVGLFVALTVATGLPAVNFTAGFEAVSAACWIPFFNDKHTRARDAAGLYDDGRVWAFEVPFSARVSTIIPHLPVAQARPCNHRGETVVASVRTIVDPCCSSDTFLASSGLQVWYQWLLTLIVALLTFLLRALQPARGEVREQAAPVKSEASADVEHGDGQGPMRALQTPLQHIVRPAQSVDKAKASSQAPVPAAKGICFDE